MKHLPNALTLGRIFLVPLLVVVLLTGFDGRSWFGLSNEIIGATIGIVGFGRIAQATARRARSSRAAPRGAPPRW